MQKAIPYSHELQMNPLTADLQDQTRELGNVLRYAAAHPGEPMSEVALSRKAEM